MWIAPTHVTAAMGAVILALLALGLALLILNLQRAWKEQQRTRGEQARVRCPFCAHTLLPNSPVCTHCYRDVHVNCGRCGNPRRVGDSGCNVCDSERLD